MKLEKKHGIGFVTPLIAILLVALLTFGNPTYIIRVLAAGTPDAHGDRIENLTIRQKQSGTFQPLVVYTYSNYSANFEVEVEAQSGTDGYINIQTWVRLNGSFADSTSEALSNTEVNVTISGGGATGLTNATAEAGVDTYQSGDWYFVDYTLGVTWQESGHPAAGQTYTLKIYYHAYY